MRSCRLLAVLALCGQASSARAAPGSDTQVYEAARRAYYLLKASGGRLHGRDPWLKVAEQFEQVARSFPRSDKAPLALYTAAELHNQLSRITLSAADRQAAAADYEKVATGYPKSSLADDALYQIARIAFDRQDDPVRARAALGKLIEHYPDGDMARRARALLATLPDAKELERPAPKVEPRKVAAKGQTPKAAPKIPKPPKPDPAVADDSDTGEPATADEALDQSQAAAGAPKPEGRPEAKAAESPPALDLARVKEKAKAESTPEKVEDPAFTLLPGLTRDAEADSDDEPPAKPAAPALKEASRKAVGSESGGHQLLDALRKIGPSPGGVPLATQMGLRVKRVVIDAGHGGHDSGAIGPGGTREKDVTLAVAKRLAAELRQQGLEVLLSRDDDSFVALEDRASFANQAHADLFISVHCNAARDRQLRGTETYFLNVTDDRYALKLAARENQASEKSLSDLQLILADMATKADVDESARLASRIQHSLTEGSGGARDPSHRDLGVKHALFYVLLGTRMPSVLVETAFLSNREDEKKLKSEQYQRELAHDIAQGVAQYIGARQGFAEAVP